MVSTPFGDAIRASSGDSWLDHVARASLRAAEANFYPGHPRPLLTVSLDDPGADSWETARMTLAVQNATAKIAHLIADPKTQTAQARRVYREKAPLMARGQSGATLFLGFPTPEADPADEPLFNMRVATLPERAAVDLLGLLPNDRTDSRAVSAALARRVTERSAINDLVRAVQEIHAGVQFAFTDHAGRTATSVLSQGQATVLEDALRQTTLDRRTITFTGLLDGMRTHRRLFYLVDESGRELSGGVDTEQLPDLRDHIGDQVIATVEEVTTVAKSGRRSHPSYRLLSLARPGDLFDE